ncbi:Centrosomal protein of 19 kDa [Borealophlyctis nickersoniae]|nr:Centrosomal protein of 19 kDa [Borealophlyctis nickersoniae]
MALLDPEQWTEFRSDLPNGASLFYVLFQTLPTSNFSTSQIHPKKLALQYSELKLILFYTSADSEHPRRRKMPIRKPTLPTSEIVSDLRARHRRYLEGVSAEQLERIVGKLLGRPAEVRKEVLAAASNDIQQQAAKPNNSRYPLGSHTPSVLGRQGLSTPEVSQTPVEIEARDPPIDGNLDLNKLSDEELQRVKAAMSFDFEKRAIKPGDAGYRYDVQVCSFRHVDPSAHS